MQREKLARTARVAAARPALPSPPKLMDSHERNKNHQQGQAHVVSARNKTKQSKPLNCKSLSHFMSKGLFFKRGKGADKASNQNDNKLTTTRSLPCVEPAYVNSLSVIAADTQPQLVGGVKSASMIGLPRRSSCNYTSTGSRNSTTLEEPSLSPIVAMGREAPSFSFSDLTATIATTSSSCQSTSSDGNPKPHPANSDKEVTEESSGDKKKGGKYKPLKNTALVLRDVKNSIGLRIKARQASQGFSKLSNELATPPTKLYSPFNIDTPDECKKLNSASKSKRKLILSSNKNKPCGSDCSMMEVDEVTVDSPKGRIALQRKKHLMEANKFTFDSPTGKVREAVKDIEHYQQRIEDISKAIRSRGRPGR